MGKGKGQVYFNEFNVLMNNAVYLPLVSGQLQAYAQTVQGIAENYQFKPIHFKRDDLEKIVALHDNPAVAAFSVSMWNENLSLTVAKKVKLNFPDCLIILGGPQIPFQAEDFFQANPFVDVTVRGEGEKTFSDLLVKNLGSRDFSDVPGISYKDCFRRVIKTGERSLEKDLDIFPSPYLEGVFDEIMDSSNIDFQAIVETNRGCPFGCAYCFWGQGGLNTKFRFFSTDRIKGVAEWIGKKGIKYVFCADSNFGMFKRDLEIARHFVDAKQKWGFPEKFRVCYGKNAEDNIFQTGKLLADHGMEKGITLSKQTSSPAALANIGRKNIRDSVFNELQKRYNQEGIPTYTELILGLPGETYQSFKDGLEQVLQSGISNQLFVYHCQVYPNTKLADKDYQKRFEISTMRAPLTEVHGEIRPVSSITEYEEFITSTSSMPQEEWKKALILGWTMQLLHGLKLGFHVSHYLADCYNVSYTDFFEYMAQQRTGVLGKEMESFGLAVNAILHGAPFCREMPEFGPIYWEQEEAGFLDISHNRSSFFNEFYDATQRFLKQRGADFSEEELREVFRYQKAITPDYKRLEETEFEFEFNTPEYLTAFNTPHQKKLIRLPQKMKLQDQKDYAGDRKEFAKERILWGRKSGRILRKIQWENK